MKKYLSYAVAGVLVLGLCVLGALSVSEPDGPRVSFAPDVADDPWDENGLHVQATIQFDAEDDEAVAIAVAALSALGGPDVAQAAATIATPVLTTGSGPGMQAKPGYVTFALGTVAVTGTYTTNGDAKALSTFATAINNSSRGLKPCNTALAASFMGEPSTAGYLAKYDNTNGKILLYAPVYTVAGASGTTQTVPLTELASGATVAGVYRWFAVCGP